MLCGRAAYGILIMLGVLGKRVNRVCVRLLPRPSKEMATLEAESSLAVLHETGRLRRVTPSREKSRPVERVVE